MNRQNVFDTCAVHLMKQFEQCSAPTDDSISKNNLYFKSHTYKYKHGVMKCAIGCLISDEAYCENIEGCDVLSAKVRAALLCSGVAVHSGEDANMINKLQRIHDIKKPTAWFQQLDSLATQFGLDNTKLVMAAVEYGRIPA